MGNSFYWCYFQAAIIHIRLNKLFREKAFVH